MTSDGNGQAPSARATEIETWLRTWIGARLVLPATQIDPQKPFSDFGVDSLTAVELSVALGDWLKTELPTTLTWDFPNIRALATGVATPAKTPTPAAAPAPAPLVNQVIARWVPCEHRNPHTWP